MFRILDFHFARFSTQGVVVGLTDIRHDMSEKHEREKFHCVEKEVKFE